MNWYACYTRARSEKKVAERLVRKGIETYLPLVPRERQWQDRRKIVDWPVFPSYVFCRFTRDAATDVLRTPGVTTVVSNGGDLTAIPDEEIDNVRHFVDALAATGEEPRPAEPWFEEGQEVRVIRGPFRGVRGRVCEVRGSRRLLVGIRGIGQALEVDLPADALEEN